MDLLAFLPSTDLDRSRAFFVDVVGLELESQDGFACRFRSGNTRLRVTLVKELEPHPFTVLGWSVPDIESAVRELEGRGASFERFDFADQDELGIWTAPGGTRVAWFKDPDGNTLSLSQGA
jgi:catechol 2,3-dioxygenase-like lactoylglutathione lyase family enzyme